MTSNTPDKRLGPDFGRNMDERDARLEGMSFEDASFESAAIAARLRLDFASILTEPIPARVTELLACLANAGSRPQRRTG